VRIQDSLEPAPRIRRCRCGERAIESNVAADGGFDCAAREAEEAVEFLGFWWLRGFCVGEKDFLAWGVGDRDGSWFWTEGLP
jgi:hypothetical protein